MLNTRTIANSVVAMVIAGVILRVLVGGPRSE